MAHGVAAAVTGPFDYSKFPNITIAELGPFNGPKALVYPDPATNRTVYSLWLGGGVYLSHSAAGPFERLDKFGYPGNNPAPAFHKGLFYFTNSPCQEVYTTPRLESGAVWSKHGTIDHSNVPPGWLPEDPHLWVDPRGHFHIVNHAYNPKEFERCAQSVLSTHFFSEDGAQWHFLKEAIQPYGHTVQYDDGSSHMFGRSPTPPRAAAGRRPPLRRSDHRAALALLRPDWPAHPPAAGCGPRHGRRGVREPHGAPALWQVPLRQLQVRGPRGDHRCAARLSLLTYICRPSARSACCWWDRSCP